LREEERRSGRAAGSVSAVVLQELGRDESLAETPFGSGPDAWLAEQRAAGADEVIITVRSPRDVAALSAMMHA
jgi:predicted subunit of tRNA(5-methylaminomethyl-2-thiouridylate) methyltransferase